MAWDDAAPTSAELKASKQDAWDASPPTKDELAQDPPDQKNTSGYEGVPDDQLAWYQKLEKAGEKIGLVRPGDELFSPKAMDNKQLTGETALNTATFGYLPQITGFGKTGETGGADYIASRDEESSRLANADPGVKAIGTTIGIVPSLVMGPASAGGKIAPRIGKMALLGAAQAGLANPGDTPGDYDPIQSSAREKNALKGGALAAAVTATLGIPEMGQELADSANLRAIKQSGAMLGNARALDRQNLIGEAGQMMMRPIETESGPVQVLTVGANAEDVADRTSKLLQSHGKRIGQIEDALDSAFPQMSADPQASQNLIHPSQVADRIESELVAPHVGTSLEEDTSKAQEFADKLRDLGDDPITFAEAKRQLGAVRNKVNWSREQSPSLELLKQASGILTDEIEKSVGKIGEASGQPWLEKYLESKDIYHAMSAINPIAEDRVFRDTMNRYMSPSDNAMGMTAAIAASAKGASGGAAAAGAAGAAAANRIVRRYGNSVAALTANNASQAISKIPQSVGQLSQAISEELPSLITSENQANASYNAPYSPLDAIQKRIQKNKK